MQYQKLSQPQLNSGRLKVAHPPTKPDRQNGQKKQHGQQEKLQTQNATPKRPPCWDVVPCYNLVGTLGPCPSFYTKSWTVGRSLISPQSCLQNRNSKLVYMFPIQHRSCWLVLESNTTWKFKDMAKRPKDVRGRGHLNGRDLHIF